jgi:hypothetical protein
MVYCHYCSFEAGDCRTSMYHVDSIDIIIISCALGVGHSDGSSVYFTANGKRCCKVLWFVINRHKGVVSITPRIRKTVTNEECFIYFFYGCARAIGFFY